MVARSFCEGAISVKSLGEGDRGLLLSLGSERDAAQSSVRALG